MIYKILAISLINLSLLSSTYAGQKDNLAPVVDNAKFEQARTEFRTYSAKLPAKVREEITTYRKAISKINRDKRDMYKKLTQEAQGYLAKEQDFKKRYSAKIMKAVLKGEQVEVGIKDVNPKS